MVLDPFMGSGTVAIAAQFLGRKWIGIDKSTEYCDLATERINSFLDGTFSIHCQLFASIRHHSKAGIAFDNPYKSRKKPVGQSPNYPIIPYGNPHAGK